MVNSVYRFSRDELYNLYRVSKMSPRKIAKEYSVSEGYIYKLLHQYNIPIFKPSERQISDETRQKLRDSHKGQIPWIVGKKHTDEARKRMSEKAKLRATDEWKTKMLAINQKHADGDTYIDSKGYVMLYKPSYVGAYANGFIAEHVYIMEQLIGRRLRKYEVVHHKDGNKQNNDIGNLALMTRSSHMKLHRNML